MLTPRNPPRILLAAVMLGSWLGLSGACFGAPGEGLLVAARRLAGGDWRGAKALFAAAAQADRQCAVALAGAGGAELALGETSAAQRSLSHALALDGNLACARIGLGTALCQVGDYQAALAHYHGALSGARDKVPALAGEAYAACALGLYDTALQQARAALEASPGHPLAKHVNAAAALGRGDPRPAASLGNGNGPARAAPSPLSLPSCLLGPGTAYARAHMREDEQRLARLGLPTAAFLQPIRPPGLAVAPQGDFRIASPSDGQALSGAVTVDIAADAQLALDYVVVLVNDSFAGVSSVRPYRVTLDTRLFADGVAEIRADGCGPQAQVLRSAMVRTRIANGNRTLAPEELAARGAVAELLEQLLLPSVSPAADRQLAGHALTQLGRLEAAAQAFEAGYAHSAETPGLRGDLLLTYLALGLQPAPAAPEVHTLRQEGRAVALTFDDGPHPLITPWVLDQLDKDGLKATFFLVGKQVTLYPELAREIRRRGHRIGCHSYAHYSLRNLSQAECEQDLVKCRLAIREACGETVALFRPPGGYYDATVRAAAGALGMTTVFWTCNITSFPGREGKQIAAELARQSADGGIILLHNGEDETLDTLPHLVGELRRRGLSFVTINPSQAGQRPGVGGAEGAGR